LLYTESSYQKHKEQYQTLDMDTYFHQITRALAPNPEIVGNVLIHQVFDTLQPFLQTYKGAQWLTVGDGKFGGDAHYIIEGGSQAMATDISDNLLAYAQQKGYIHQYQAENAEAISFADGAFDFVLCKEAYHHFPRPYIAVYEMLRVARKAVILIEPVDNLIHSPLLAQWVGIESTIERWFKRPFQLYRNRYTFEPVGNFVYKISEREIEKLALGIGLRQVAFKHLYYPFSLTTEQSLLPLSSGYYRKYKLINAIVDMLFELGLTAKSVLVAVIFKETIDNALSAALDKADFHIQHLPKNPYA
jgi:ubiquinone/menaquinone biosynthesis C-methylase UbiE